MPGSLINTCIKDYVFFHPTNKSNKALLGKTTAAYFMVRVAVEDDNGNKVLTTVQAHRGKSSLRDSYQYLECATVALIETGREDGYTEDRGVFNIVSSNHFNLPSGFDDYAVSQHLKCNPDPIRLYFNARKQCNKLGRNALIKRSSSKGFLLLIINLLQSLSFQLPTMRVVSILYHIL